MIPAFGLRLNLRDAVCDRHEIYVDDVTIASRPSDLPLADWETFCRFVCGKVPTEDWLDLTPAPADDPECWSRLETYMAQKDAEVFKDWA